MMFVLTLLSTLMAGALQRGFAPDAVFSQPAALLAGLPFSLTLLLILGAHEMGHYVASRKWGVDASLPYFLPAPSLLGTFGAVIRIRGGILNRNALMDVAVAGPLAGLAAAVPALIIGLMMSRLAPGGSSLGIGLGTPLLFDGLHPQGPDHPPPPGGLCGLVRVAGDVAQSHPRRTTRRRPRHLHASRGVAREDIARRGSRPSGDGVLVARLGFLERDRARAGQAASATHGRVGASDAQEAYLGICVYDAPGLYVHPDARSAVLACFW
ncbi:MAG: site-2 protease family protein [Nitrospinae bacterium]|nr:site-2 protease family protein [Nitrospinota bacterium]